MPLQEPEGPPAAHMRLPPFDGGKSFPYTTVVNTDGKCPPLTLEFHWLIPKEGRGPVPL